MAECARQSGRSMVRRGWRTRIVNEKASNVVILLLTKSSLLQQRNSSLSRFKPRGCVSLSLLHASQSVQNSDRNEPLCVTCCFSIILYGTVHDQYFSLNVLNYFGFFDSFSGFFAHHSITDVRRHSSATHQEVRSKTNNGVRFARHVQYNCNISTSFSLHFPSTKLYLKGRFFSSVGLV